ncbi:hypothetical protein [Pedobacter hartonius]|uniref:Uncharacterized protein n=1 Tax=Pedobacter hartonius TaxID=425514 RepID=A0A1H4H228_9SPHI|nr:hypothetical protein [Pedobacter hartonius]SEB15062.1 hypothetical protein SAMN05443550_112104 [Pedobacter hartonius]
MKDIQTLKFYWLKYEVSDIREMINNSPGIDNFVFTYYFPNTADEDKPIQLIAYAHMDSKDPVEARYSDYYDTLEVYNSNALEAGGPLMMSNNILSLNSMQALINSMGPNGDKPEFLVFVPNVNNSGHVYYDIVAYTRRGGEESPLPGNGSIIDTTNPSPPATLQEQSAVA